MKRRSCLAFLLLTPFLALGCGSKPAPPELNEETLNAIEENDKAIDAAENAQ